MSLATQAPSEQASIPLSSIEVVYNPRRAFRKEPLQRLVDSIRDAGLITPIAVRPCDASEGYELIAGERRLRAVRELAWQDVPALIIHCDPVEAKRLAALENLDRADLSASEEAYVARDALDAAGGDRVAAASQLGWSATKMDARLLLLMASADVLDAVAQGTIHLGHAELLAGLPEEQQNKALGRIIESNVPVAALREQIKGVVIPLSRAIFPTGAGSKCATCPHNSALQQTLFGESIEGANCKNRVCFNELTQAALEAKRASLAEEVGTVALSTEKDEATYTSLIVNGMGGVGAEQFSQCRSCIHFGALIHAKPDARLGQVERPMCFDVACNKLRVASYAEQLAEQAAPTTDTTTVDTTGDNATPAAVGAPATSRAATVAKRPAKAAAPAASSNAARAAMKPAYAAAASVLLADSTSVPFALAIMGMGKVLAEAGIALPAGLTISGKKPEDVIASILKKDQSEVVALFRACTMAFVAGDQGQSSFSRNDVFPAVIAASLAQASKADLAPHFAMSDAFLAAHTKEGIAALLDESGFKAWLAAQDEGDKKSRAIHAAKKVDLPKAIMDAGFDWSGFVPKSVAHVVPRSFVGT